MYFKHLLPVLALGLTPAIASAQADTVVIPLAETSKIVFTIEDRRDIKTLRHYNFQKLFNDVFNRLDTAYVAPDTEVVSVEEAEPAEEPSEEKDGQRRRDPQVGWTRQAFDIDLGLNNYMAGDQFPTGDELYAVRPWGSWYIAGNSVHRTRLGRRAFVELGLGVSWYSFKFQEDNMTLSREAGGVVFSQDDREVDFIKSKLSATFLNASLVPVLDFGRNTVKGKGDGFRFGVGPYVGYRISSKTKLVYEVDDDRKREKNRDNFYLNNLRYGLRMQIGIRSTDIFVNYDLNDFFATDKGPKLNAVSFGFIL